MLRSLGFQLEFHFIQIKQPLKAQKGQVFPQVNMLETHKFKVTCCQDVSGDL